MDGCTTHQTRHLQVGLPLCLVPQIPQTDSGGQNRHLYRTEIRRLCAEQDWTIGALNIQPDHVHLFLSAPPTVAPSEIAHQLKGATARAVFQRFPEIKNQLWGVAFWSRSYYVGSVGDMSLVVVLKYIELGQD
jgi:REP element-mobilizing transposase RayT